MIVSTEFWLILGLGIAIPFTGVAIMNLLIKLVSGDSYVLDLKKLGIVYIIALLGWAIALGVR